MDDSKMHLQILLILGLLQQLFAVGVNTSDGVLDIARSLNETSFPVNLENKNRESEDYRSDFPDNDIEPTTVTTVNSSYLHRKNQIHSFSTAKPEETVVRTFISTILNVDNSTNDPVPSRQETDKLKDSVSTLPITSPEPKSTSQDIPGKMFSSSPKSTIHESSTNSLSKDSTIRRATPFPYTFIRSFVNNITNSSSGSPNTTVENHGNTKSPIYLKYRARSLGQIENFYTMPNEQSNVSHNDQDSINSSLEMTTPLHELHLSDNLKIETDTTNGSSEMMTPLYEVHVSDNLKNEIGSTETVFEPPEKHVESFEKYEASKVFSVNATSPKSPIGSNKNNSQLSSNHKNLINESSEMTLLYASHLSDNFKNETNTTPIVFESLEDNQSNKTQELLTNAVSSKNQNNENLDSFLSKRQDKSASIDHQQQDENALSSSVTTSTLSLNSNSGFSDLSLHNMSSVDTTISISENTASSNTDWKFNSEIESETASTTLINQKNSDENWSDSTDTTLIEDETPFIIKEEEEYTVTVPKICSNYSTINRLLHLLNVSPNSKRQANFTCENLKDMTIAVKSKELFFKINELLKAEAKTDDIVFIKVNPNATIAFEIHSQSSPNGVFVPMIAIIIFGAVALFILFVILCVSLYKMKCRKHSTSLDLHNIPHLNLKTDFNLTPIPRPSISFPDNNRDFLHAYAPDNYSLSRQDNTLHKRTCSGTMSKTYEEVQKEIGSKQEMQTFTMSSNRKSEFKPSRSQDYPSAHSWDRLQENNYSKKFGVDNPVYRRW